MFDFLKKKKIAPPKPEPVQTTFVEGRDYYIDQGLYVFTERYLKNRGYCCGNGCRHCPYQE